MQIEEDEIDDLVSRIKKINGGENARPHLAGSSHALMLGSFFVSIIVTVEVREERFKEKIISSGGQLSSVMDIIKNLMADDLSGDNEIFVIKD